MSQRVNWCKIRTQAVEQVQTLYWEFKSEFQVLWKLGYSEDAVLVTLVQLADFDKKKYRALRKAFYNPEQGSEESFYRLLRNEVEFCLKSYPEDTFSTIRMMLGPCITGIHQVLGMMSKEDRWRAKCEKALQRRIELQISQNEEYHKTIAPEVKHGKERDY